MLEVSRVPGTIWQEPLRKTPSRHTALHLPTNQGMSSYGLVAICKPGPGKAWINLLVWCGDAFFILSKTVIRLCVQQTLFTDSFSNVIMAQCICSCTYSSTQSLTCLLAHSRNHSLTRSLTRSLTHSLTNSSAGCHTMPKCASSHTDREDLHVAAIQHFLGVDARSIIRLAVCKLVPAKYGHCEDI